VHGVWRISTKYELRNYILFLQHTLKEKRLEWLGHVIRINQSKVAK